MENNKVLAQQFGILKQIMEINASDVSQEDSLISSPSNGNSVNWLVGHMIVVRDTIIKTVGGETIADEKMHQLYDRGKPNITVENAMNIKTLLDMYYEGSGKIIAGLNEKELTEEKDIELLATLSFHESYHAGQIGLFRRLMGKEPKIK